LQLTDTKVNVTPFSDEYKAIKDIPIATVATAWDDPAGGPTVILVVNEALYFGDRMNHSLLCPNQIRANGLVVNDVPKQFDGTSLHAIMDPKSETKLPLLLSGVISYLETRKPTDEELEECMHIELTSPTPWEPYDEGFEKAEARVVDAVVTTDGDPPAMIDEDREFGERLIASVRVAADDFEGDGLSGMLDPDLYTVTGDNRRVMEMSSSQVTPTLTKEVLARKWHIGLDKAQKTLHATDHTGLRTVIHPLTRRYQTRQPHMCYPRVEKQLYSDTLFAKTKSLRMHTCAQVFTNGTAYTKFYPMKSKKEAGERLERLITELGVIPATIITDGAAEETGGDWKETVSKYHIRHKLTEPYSPWQNRTELEIRELKKSIRRLLASTGAPTRLWCYAGEWIAQIRRHTVHDLMALDERTPVEHFTGFTPNIAPLCTFSFYDYCWHWMPVEGFPQERKQLGRWIGVAHDVGGPLTYWVLTEKCKVVARSSVTPLTELELKEPLIRAQAVTLDDAIKAKIGKHRTDEEVEEELDGLFPTTGDLLGDEDIDDGMEPFEADAAMPEADEWTPETFDQYLTAEVLLPVRGELVKARVTGRKRGADGNPVGTANANPILDSREYEAKFQNGSKRYR